MCCYNRIILFKTGIEEQDILILKNLRPHKNLLQIISEMLYTFGIVCMKYILFFLISLWFIVQKTCQIKNDLYNEEYLFGYILILKCIRCVMIH